MLFRRRIAPNVFMMTGLVALVAANTGQTILRHTHRPAGPLADAITGFLFGVAIASLLVWVTVRGRRRG